jgi:hypothetical protein
MPDQEILMMVLQPLVIHLVGLEITHTEYGIMDHGTLLKDIHMEYHILKYTYGNELLRR